MRKAKSTATLADLPSFGQPPKIYGSDQVAAAVKSDNGAVDDGGVEFAFVVEEPVPHLPMPADEIFSGGKICPLYSVNRNLRLTDAATTAAENPKRPRLLQFLIEEHEYATSPSSGNELEGVSPETYCLWSPGSPGGLQGRIEETCSTEWLFRRMIRDLLVCSRLSRGKERIVFLTAEKKRSLRNKLAKWDRRKEKEGDGGERRGSNGSDRNSPAELRPEWSCSWSEWSCSRPDFASHQP